MCVKYIDKKLILSKILNFRHKPWPRTLKPLPNSGATGPKVLIKL